VTLESGEQIEARIVLSSLDSRWTFIKLLEDGVLDPTFREEVLRYKYRGSSGKVNLALDGLPELACKPGTGEWLRGAVSFSPSLDYMERAYDDAKYGRPSRRPYIDMIIPTLVDPTMAPPGGHVMSCFVQYAPYRLAGDDVWDDTAREAFGQNVIDTISERFPTIRRHIVGSQFITPKDIEDITGLTEGNIFQGELSLEQLFFNRPVPGWARYRTPVRDLWMCGSATHPGGGIMGAPGRIAALEVLKGGKRGQKHRRERGGRAA
jgi:phytoene dehydrogenase-like protein